MPPTPAASGTTPHAPACTPTSTPKRVTALEIKASFAEDLLDKLDQTIIRQQGHQIMRWCTKCLQLAPASLRPTGCGAALAA
jgi:hypothetical protein